MKMKANHCACRLDLPKYILNKINKIKPVFSFKMHVVWGVGYLHNKIDLYFSPTNRVISASALRFLPLSPDKVVNWMSTQHSCPHVISRASLLSILEMLGVVVKVGQSMASQPPGWLNFAWVSESIVWQFPWCSSVSMLQVQKAKRCADHWQNRCAPIDRIPWLPLLRWRLLTVPTLWQSKMAKRCRPTWDRR